MTVKISDSTTENGIVVGNTCDKYGTRNSVVKHIIQGVEHALSDLVKASPRAIYEVGCGEGYWVLRWHDQGLTVRGCDFSSRVIDLARENGTSRGPSPDLF